MTSLKLSHLSVIMQLMMLFSVTWAIELVAHLCNFYSLNPSMYYSIAITVMEKTHIDIHPRKKEVRF